MVTKYIIVCYSYGSILTLQTQVSVQVVEHIVIIKHTWQFHVNHHQLSTRIINMKIVVWVLYYWCCCHFSELQDKTISVMLALLTVNSIFFEKSQCFLFWDVVVLEVTLHVVLINSIKINTLSYRIFNIIYPIPS
jgi:hypothetical protein